MLKRKPLNIKEKEDICRVMFSGKINSYRYYINSKRRYLKRKKLIKREIRRVRKRQRLCKSLGRKYLDRIIQRGEDDLDILKFMYNYHKFLK